jgi:hypothetical protein
MEICNQRIEHEEYGTAEDDCVEAEKLLKPSKVIGYALLTLYCRIHQVNNV